MAMNTDARPSRMAAMASTVFRPATRGAVMAKASSSRSRNAGSGCSVTPMVRSPWTLEWPRTGQAPAPGRPMLPPISSMSTNVWMVITACLCWVMPMAQVKIVRSAAL